MHLSTLRFVLDQAMGRFVSNLVELQVVSIAST